MFATCYVLLGPRDVTMAMIHFLDSLRKEVVRYDLARVGKLGPAGSLLLEPSHPYLFMFVYGCSHNVMAQLTTCDRGCLA